MNEDPTNKNDREPLAPATEETTDPAEEMSEETTTRLGRFLKLSGLSGRVGAEYLGKAARGAFAGKERRQELLGEAHLANAKRVAETFGELKGAVMKLGQMMSLQSYDFLPRELTEMLRGLQKDAPPMAFSKIKEQIRNELGQDPKDVFGALEPRAHASASIGQVHRAVLRDGRKVVVKVQYPGVDEMVDADLANLESIIGNVVKLLYHGEIKTLMAEVRERIGEELDYRLELANLQEYWERFAEDDSILVPKPVPELCSKRILVMERLTGEDGNSLAQGDVPQERRDDIGKRLVAFLFKQFFQFHVIHADPNLANFAFLPDNRVIVYDFGCVKRFPEEFVSGYKVALRQGLRRDWAGLTETMKSLGMYHLEDKVYPESWYAELAEPAMRPFSGKMYDFSTCHVAEDLHKVSLKNFGEWSRWQIPRHQLFLNRVIVGMYGNLRHLRARVNVLELLEPYLE